MEQERELVQKAKSKDAQAFAKLYGAVYRDLYRFALYTLKNSHDAEDAVSDAVTDAWAQIGALRQEGSFKSWMFAILSNKCRRKLKQYTQREEELPKELCALQHDTAMDLDVRAAFFGLDEEERLILSLRIFGGYSSREIGNTLGINDSTVRSRQKRALEKMRGHLM